MAYGNMTPAVSGNPASASANNQIITNVDDLDTRLDTVEATVNGVGSTGSGNATLSTRLGTGVTTASTATAQFTAVNSTITNTSGGVGIGNQRLSDRLGSGVTNTADVTTGTATAQLTDVRTRLTAVEAASGFTKPIGKFYRPYTGSGGTSQVVTNSTWTAVLFPNEAVDTINGHSTSTNTSRYTPNVAGWYKVSGVVMGTATASIGVGAQIRKNNTILDGAAYTGILGSAAIAPGAFTEAFVQLNGSTDYVELFGWVSTGAAFVSGADYAPYMMVEWVSP